MIVAPFAPRFGSGVTVAPGVASARTEIGVGSKTVCLTNLDAAVVAYVAVGGSGVTATVADYPVLASSQVVISKDQDHTHVAYITSAGASSLHILPGEGF